MPKNRKKTKSTLQDRGISRKDLLQKARNVKNDEFYTRYEDIEKEIARYDKTIWHRKTVFCNCDDGADENRSSAFARYFLGNFKTLGLKKLICTHYSRGRDLFMPGEKPYIFTKEDSPDQPERKIFPKNYTGGFEDPLSLKILREEADIVCTNPPFSKAKEFWKILLESGKQFLIISNILNVKNDAYIPYFTAGKVRAGYNEADWYETPEKGLTRAAGYWFTNFPVKNRPKYKNLKILPLEAIPEKYKRFDDARILLTDRNYIPGDYEKPFAVSVYPIVSGLLEKGFRILQEKQYRPYIQGREVFARLLIQKV